MKFTNKDFNYIDKNLADSYFNNAYMFKIDGEG